MKPLSESRWRRLKRYLQLAVALAFFVVALTFSLDRVRGAFSAEGWEIWPLPQLSAVVLLFSLALVFLWYHAVDGEMQMLSDYGEEFVPDPPGGTLNAAIALSVVLGLLVYFSYSALLFSAVFAGLKVLEMWVVGLRNAKLREGFRHARASSPIDDPRRDAWDIIEGFYFAKRFKALAVVEVAFTASAVALAVVGELISGGAWERWLSSSAYVVVMATMVMNERCISRERRRRDAALGERYW